MSNEKDFLSPKPGDEHTFKPVTPPSMYDCPYCKIISGEKGKEDILSQSEKSMVIKNQNREESSDIFLVITKKHYMDMSSVDSWDLLDLATLLKKYVNGIENKEATSFKYASLQGKEAGQDVFHFSWKVTPVK